MKQWWLDIFTVNGLIGTFDFYSQQPTPTQIEQSLHLTHQLIDDIDGSYLMWDYEEGNR